MSSSASEAAAAVVFLAEALLTPVPVARGLLTLFLLVVDFILAIY
jgi:hypothetical protein